MSPEELITAIQNCDRTPLSQAFCAELIRRKYAVHADGGWAWNIDALRALSHDTLKQLHNALTAKV